MWKGQTTPQRFKLVFGLGRAVRYTPSSNVIEAASGFSRLICEMCS